MLRPGLQLLRPPKKDARDGPGIVAGFVAYNSDAFREDYGIEPWQVLLTPLQSGKTLWNVCPSRQDRTCRAFLDFRKEVRITSHWSTVQGK